MPHRIEKINELIKQKLAELLLIDFPSQIIDINFVYTKPDLSESTIFISVSSGQQSIYKEINRSAGKYRKNLANNLYIRKMPKLVFKKDSSQGSINRIDEILNDDAKARKS